MNKKEKQRLEHLETECRKTTEELYYLQKKQFISNNKSIVGKTFFDPDEFNGRNKVLFLGEKNHEYHTYYHIIGITPSNYDIGYLAIVDLPVGIQTRRGMMIHDYIKFGHFFSYSGDVGIRPGLVEVSEQTWGEVYSRALANIHRFSPNKL